MTISRAALYTAFLAEISQARAARAIGNEGMARVCARRAAGLAIRAYFEENHIPYSGQSTYDHIKQLSRLQGISSRVSEVTEQLLMRVTPQHTLAIDTDLILETLWLARELLGEEW